MKFESFNQPKIVSVTESEETEKASSELEEAFEPKNEIQKRANKLARLALGALTFYGVADVAEMLVLRDAGAAAYAAESQTLAENVSTGKVRLSSGEEITIPKPGELFDHVMVYTPEGKAPDRLIMLFSQTHRLSKEQLEGDTAAERMQALEEANDSQRRIYTGLKQLIDAGSLYTVCSEGSTDWQGTKWGVEAFSEHGTSTSVDILVNYFPASDLEQAVKNAGKRYDEINIGSLKAHTSIESIMKTDPVIARYIKKYKYIGGATELLAAEGELIPCPGEESVAYETSDKVSYLFDKPIAERTLEESILFKKLMFEDREDAAIETIMTNIPDPVVGLSFGAGHDFTNNVDQWNARHPDQQIGLVDMRAPYH